MALDFETASDRVLALVAEAAQGPMEELLGYVPDVEWPDTMDPEPSGRRPSDRVWMRVGLRHVDAQQRSFGEPGGRRFGRTALLSVQLLHPKGPRGFTILQRLGKVVVDALEGRNLDGVTVGQAIFREGTAVESSWQQANVTATLNYDVVK